MEQEQLQDWRFRYQHIYRIRRTKKQKQRFLSALVADIMKMRSDISVIEYKQNKKYVSSNLYVGNIQQAETIICTYYDTPPRSIGAYDLFNRVKQRQSVTAFILLSVVVSLLVGLGGTWGYTRMTAEAFDLRSISTLVAIAGYGLYFYLFSQVAKGLSSRQTVVRNTSSILTLLELIEGDKESKTAYAFIDEGCFGELGLEALKASCRQSAKIYWLDCVGADTPLHVIGTGLPAEKTEKLVCHPPMNAVTYLVGARVSETPQGKRYYLKPSDLKKLNTDNLTTVKALFQ